MVRQRAAATGAGAMMQAAFVILAPLDTTAH